MEVVVVLGLVVAALYWLGKRQQGEDEPRSSGRRRASGPSHVPSAPPPLDPSTERVPVSAQGRVEVVGESNYQPALKAAAGGRVVPPGDLERAIKVEAVLLPEPTNRYDSNAVRVDIGGRTVGYLSRQNAVRYQPVLLWLTERGHVAVCPARVMGGGRKRNYGVHLHLGPPERLVMWNSASGIDVLEGDRMVVVSGTKEHQGVLGRLDGSGPAGVFPMVVVTFAVGEIERGKYAGLPCVDVLLDGERVGALTYRMSQQYLPQVQRRLDEASRVGAEAFVSRDGEALKMHVFLPRI